MSNRISGTERSFGIAKQCYAELGVDIDQAMVRLEPIQISLHCRQGDDVVGFEHRGDPLGGGLAVTGDYPGRARGPAELRSDLDQAWRLIPGTHRLNLHASYAETGDTIVERNELEPAHFQAWIDLAKAKGMGLDFNPTFFAHEKAVDGITLAHADDAVRDSHDILFCHPERGEGPRIDVNSSRRSKSQPRKIMSC